MTKQLMIRNELICPFAFLLIIHRHVQSSVFLVSIPVDDWQISRLRLDDRFDDVKFLQGFVQVGIGCKEKVLQFFDVVRNHPRNAFVNATATPLPLSASFVVRAARTRASRDA